MMNILWHNLLTFIEMMEAINQKFRIGNKKRLRLVYTKREREHELKLCRKSDGFPRELPF